MTTFQRVSIAVGALAVAVVLCMLANHWLKPRVFPGQGAAQPKAVQHAAATVERVEQSADGTRVCFSIRSFDELPAADRSFYQTTEEARAAGHGPRCVTTHNSAAAGLTQGAKLDVFFTLANGGKIAIVRIAAGRSEL
jgi:hypothetical protein